MAFGFAGAAAGSTRALEDIVAERMMREKLAQAVEERQRAFQLDQERQAETERQNAFVRDQASKPRPDPLVEYEGKKKIDQRYEKPAVIKPERDPIADYEAKKKIDTKYARPVAGPRTPQFVRMPDGSVKDINGVAPQGAVPFDAVAERQQADKKAGGDRAVEAMRTYGDDMLSVINDMIDENGNLKPEVAGVVGGFDGARPEWAYGSEGSQKALAAINRLQGMLDLQRLGEMKAQSRTGASGFGALSEKELAVLEGSASTLRNRRQGDVSYGSELKRIRDAINSGRQVAPAQAPAPGGGAPGKIAFAFNPATGKLEPVKQ